MPQYLSENSIGLKKHRFEDLNGRERKKVFDDFLRHTLRYGQLHKNDWEGLWRIRDGKASFLLTSVARPYSFAPPPLSLKSPPQDSAKCPEDLMKNLFALISLPKDLGKNQFWVKDLNFFQEGDDKSWILMCDLIKKFPIVYAETFGHYLVIEDLQPLEFRGINNQADHFCKLCLDLVSKLNVLVKG